MLGGQGLLGSWDVADVTHYCSVELLCTSLWSFKRFFIAFLSRQDFRELYMQWMDESSDQPRLWNNLFRWKVHPSLQIKWFIPRKVFFRDSVQCFIVQGHCPWHHFNLHDEVFPVGELVLYLIPRTTHHLWFVELLFKYHHYSLLSVHYGQVNVLFHKLSQQHAWKNTMTTYANETDSGLLKTLATLKHRSSTGVMADTSMADTTMALQQPPDGLPPGQLPRHSCGEC